ncbi:MAG: hypothetical protein ACRD15_19630 [Vicinamibacterales bacterium]
MRASVDSHGGGNTGEAQALGLVIALAATRVLRAFLFEVSTTDPMSLAMVTALLIAAALMASVLPARRAVRLDPVAALRSE